MEDDRAGADEGLFADLHPREQDGAAPDSRAAAPGNPTVMKCGCPAEMSTSTSTR